MADNGNHVWARDAWGEVRKLKWAIFASALPIILLDLLDIRLDLTSRWAPLLHKFGLVGMALIFAQVSWRASFGEYVDLSDLLERAKRGEPGAPLTFAGAAALRAVYYAAVVLAFTMGL